MRNMDRLWIYITVLDDWLFDGRFSAVRCRSEIRLTLAVDELGIGLGLKENCEF